MGKKIYIIEDEPAMVDLLKFILADEGYTVYTYNNGEKALSSLETNNPDLILLDLMLPGMSGFEVCRIIKDNPKTWKIPLIILTSRSDEFDIVTGINLGCDDYIIKPFNQKILLAKIKSFLKKEEKEETLNKLIKIKDLNINPIQHEVTIKNKIINLTVSEFKILYLLASHINRVFNRNQIYEAIRDTEICPGDRSIDILIGRIRKKIGSYSKYIETIYGVGYRFIKPEVQV